VSDENLRAEAAQRLVELRAAFGDRLKVRLDELAEALARAREGALESRDQARLLAHRLAGTAGSYGYDGAGRHAATIELLLAADAPLGEADWRVIAEALAAARQT
jgi:HPt (histidine-containing phosphotransfer) domain-containing protein